MYRDDFMDLSDAQAITVTTDSTNYIDTLAAGWAEDEEMYVKFQINTAFVGTTAATLQMAIQIAQDTAFATVLTVLFINATTASLPAGAVWAVKLPSALVTKGYRYIRAYYTVTGNTYTAGKIDAALCKDVDVFLETIH